MSKRAEANDLSPEQRLLLEKLLQKDGIDLARSPLGVQRGASAPLSFVQERLWASGERALGTSFGNLPLAFLQNYDEAMRPAEMSLLNRALKSVTKSASTVAVESD